MPFRKCIFFKYHVNIVGLIKNNNNFSSSKNMSSFDAHGNTSKINQFSLLKTLNDYQSMSQFVQSMTYCGILIRLIDADLIGESEEITVSRSERKWDMTFSIGGLIGGKREGLRGF